MKVLQIHNRYQQYGGEDVVCDSERELLCEMGHEVELLEFNNDDITSWTQKIITAFGAVYSWKARKVVIREIDRVKPDIIHVHNFFPLVSPSVYDACRARGIPVVQSLHNYRIFCPNGMVVRQGRLCDVCIGRKIPLRGIVNGCYRGSRIGSSMLALMSAVHWLKGTWERNVTAYIALTNFARGKLVQAGLPADRIYVKQNFIVDTMTKEGGSRNLVIWVGRLSKEKGVDTLIGAYNTCELAVPLLIIGGGPLREELEEQARVGSRSEIIEFLGKIGRQEVYELMARARFMIMTSVGYEGFPMVIVEAFSKGTPVICPRLGSMGEVVEDGVSGIHYNPGNEKDLSEKIRWAFDNPVTMEKMGRNARRIYEERYTPDVNYKILMGVYEQAMSVGISDTKEKSEHDGRSELR